jgi:hypothetical protein
MMRHFRDVWNYVIKLCRWTQPFMGSVPENDSKGAKACWRKPFILSKSAWLLSPPIPYRSPFAIQWKQLANFSSGSLGQVNMGTGQKPTSD